MDAAELTRWTRFAAKGGIGKCTAIQDCVAEGEEDLMFLKDDEIVVLMQIPNLEDVYLGYCEGVVGRFQGFAVRFHSKLKKPVMTKRSSVVQAKPPTPSAVSPVTPPMISPSSSSGASGSYTPMLAKSVSPVSSPPPVQVYQPSSRRGSQRASNASSAGTFGQNNPYTTDEESLDKETHRSFASTSTHSYRSTSYMSDYASPTSPDTKNFTFHSGASFSSSPPPISSSPSAVNTSPRDSVRSGTSPIQSSSIPHNRSTSKLPSMLERMSSVDSRMNASDVPDEWVRQEVGALLAEKAVEEEVETDRTQKTRRVSRASSHFGYGGSSDEEESVLGGRRFSTTSGASDDGQVGIGLSLMSALAGSDSDSDDDEHGILGRGRNGADSSDDDEDKTVEGGHHMATSNSPVVALQKSGIHHTQRPSADSSMRSDESGSAETINAHGIPMPAKESDNVSSTTSSVAVPPRKDSLGFRIDTSKQSNLSISSTSSHHLPPPSPSHSEGSFDHNYSPHSPHPSEGDEWEGASDIYDNYRYSRHSRYSRYSINSVHSTKSHRQLPSTSTMPVWQGGAMGSPTGSSFPPPGALGTLGTPGSPLVGGSYGPGGGGYFSAADTGDQSPLSKPVGKEAEDSPIDPSVPSSTTSSTFDASTSEASAPRQPRANFGAFGAFPGGIMISTTTTTTVVEHEEDAPSSAAVKQDKPQRAMSVASTVDSHYSHDSESHYSPDDGYSLSSPARGYLTADGEDSPFPSGFSAVSGLSVSPASASPSTEEHMYAYTKPSHLSMLEANAASFLSPENAKFWETTEKLNIMKSPPGQENSPEGSTEKPPVSAAGSSSTDATGEQVEESIVIVSPDEKVITPPGKHATLAPESSPPPAREREPKGRPAPLNLLSTASTEITGASPLLHTRWGSPVSSTGISSGSVSVYDERSSVGSAFPAGIHNSGAAESNVGSGGLLSPGLSSSEIGHGSRGARGMASALRERLETDQPKSPFSPSFDTGKIKADDAHMPLVVEDDEELPSHARNASKDFDGEGDATMETDSGEKDTSMTSDGTYATRVLDDLQDQSIVESSGQKTGLSGLAKLVITSDEAIKESRSRTPSPASLVVQDSPPSKDVGPSPMSAGPPPSPSAFPIPPTHHGELSVPSVSLPQVNPAQAHLRPNVVGDGERRSLFLPHPNAPKAPTENGIGPMGPLYQGGNSPQQSVFNLNQSASHRIDPKKLALHAIRLALAAPPPPQPIHPLPSSMPIRGKDGKPAPAPPPPPPSRGPTIYARVDVDLASASGPVPITFGIEPMGPPPLPAMPPLPETSTIPQGPSQSHGSPSLHVTVPMSRATPSPLRVGSPAVPEVQRQTSAMKDIGLGVPRSPLAPPSPLKDVPFFDEGGRSSPQVKRSVSASPHVPVNEPSGMRSSSDALKRNVTTSASIPTSSSTRSLPMRGSGELSVSRPFLRTTEGDDGLPTSNTQASSNTSLPIPRENFMPTVGAMRPRSRSFSAFNSPPVKDSRGGFRDDTGSPTTPRPGFSTSTGSSSSLRNVTSPPLASSSSFDSSSQPHLSKSGSISKFHGSHIPSPLSLQHNSRTGSIGMKPPLSPLASASSSTFSHQNPSSPRTNSTVPPSPVSSTRSSSQLRKATSMASFPSTRSSSGNADSSPPPSPLTSRMSGKQSFQSMDGAAAAGSNSHSRQSTLDTPPILPGAGTPAGRMSDPETMSILSFRSQAISPPPMGHHNSLRSKLSLPNMRRVPSRHDSVSSSVYPVPESETVQVKDMDFELVKPNLAFLDANPRASEDSSVLDPASSRGDTDLPDHLRADSPAISISSSVSKTPGGLAADSAALRARASSKASDNEASMESHRQRELKWVTIMSNVPPSQSRKNKKVRKLIGEGVPSSVRYLVWSHMTDCKAKNVPGVYASFGKRARITAFTNVETDVRKCFGEHEHLQTKEGPVMALLQAYLTMVPDVPYSTGLTLIAGHLLLLAPEEDAFWIFVSMMDPVLRPYFSPNSTQMEVDAALFSRALEANDAATSKKLLMDMSINPTHICAPWFSTLFVGCLPSDYVNRVWDFFLYEGIPFLIRVGLAIIYCCRRALLDATSEELVLRYLRQPSPNWLPPSADAFISLTLSFKLKDDDIRKQRIKMEAQVKRQVQQAPRSTTGAISLPR
ncbi:hypothetical protein Moror_12639 [Moniliophthora roreri MCA 2997]|uniref:Rab-GAP TBC domain-containing protein n=1 Tax=Moniliophthora roreri (strain MCA 2997) TaxID=1381753 RepID=V2XSN4_MONRO|nr:hypothetical protein Moror_12639 [Moniliophthora roreri MCA 2997]